MAQEAQVKVNIMTEKNTLQRFLDGTDDWVLLKFKNADGETCTTDYLNRKSRNSLDNPGTTVILSEELGMCRKNFR